jgi:uncharacterized cysteine cluster protein YcgN (CxxCxxCC family)
MRITKKVQKTEEVLDEVICDVCGLSCMVHFNKNEPDGPKDFVGIHIQQPWGYLSNKDLEIWEADICEKCVDDWLSHMVKFKKSNFIRGRLF